MSGLPDPAELPIGPLRPRYYVLRVLGCERDFTPTHVSASSGPHATLIDAWRRADMFSREFEGEVFIAGEQCA